MSLFSDNSVVYGEISAQLGVDICDYVGYDLIGRTLRGAYSVDKDLQNVTVNNLLKVTHFPIQRRVFEYPFHLNTEEILLLRLSFPQIEFIPVGKCEDSNQNLTRPHTHALAATVYEVLMDEYVRPEISKPQCEGRVNVIWRRGKGKSICQNDPGSLHVCSPYDNSSDVARAGVLLDKLRNMNPELDKHHEWAKKVYRNFESITCFDPLNCRIRGKILFQDFSVVRDTPEAFAQSMINHSCDKGIVFVVNPIPTMYSMQGTVQLLGQSWKKEDTTGLFAKFANKITRFLSENKGEFHACSTATVGYFFPDGSDTYVYDQANMLKWWLCDYIAVGRRYFHVTRHMIGKMREIAVLTIMEIQDPPPKTLTIRHFPTGVEPGTSMVHTVAFRDTIQNGLDSNKLKRISFPVPSDIVAQIVSFALTTAGKDKKPDQVKVLAYAISVISRSFREGTTAQNAAIISPEQQVPFLIAVMVHVFATFGKYTSTVSRAVKDEKAARDRNWFGRFVDLFKWDMSLNEESTVASIADVAVSYGHSDNSISGAIKQLARDFMRFVKIDVTHMRTFSFIKIVPIPTSVEYQSEPHFDYITLILGDVKQAVMQAVEEYNQVIPYATAASILQQVARVARQEISLPDALARIHDKEARERRLAKITTSFSKCFEVLVDFDVPRDGKCLIHALGEAIGADYRLVLKYLNMPDEDYQGLPTADTCEKFANATGLGVCVHDDDVGVVYRFGEAVLHLRVGGKHTRGCRVILGPEAPVRKMARSIPERSFWSPELIKARTDVLCEVGAKTQAQSLVVVGIPDFDVLRYAQKTGVKNVLITQVPDCTKRYHDMYAATYSCDTLNIRVHYRGEQHGVESGLVSHIHLAAGCDLYGDSAVSCDRVLELYGSMAESRGVVTASLLDATEIDKDYTELGVCYISSALKRESVRRTLVTFNGMELRRSFDPEKLAGMASPYSIGYKALGYSVSDYDPYFLYTRYYPDSAPVNMVFVPHPNIRLVRNTPSCPEVLLASNFNIHPVYEALSAHGLDGYEVVNKKGYGEHAVYPECVVCFLAEMNVKRISPEQAAVIFDFVVKALQESGYEEVYMPYDAIASSQRWLNILSNALLDKDVTLYVVVSEKEAVELEKVVKVNNGPALCTDALAKQVRITTSQDTLMSWTECHSEERRVFHSDERSMLLGDDVRRFDMLGTSGRDSEKWPTPNQDLDAVIFLSLGAFSDEEEKIVSGLEKLRMEVLAQGGVVVVFDDLQDYINGYVARWNYGVFEFPGEDDNGSSLPKRILYDCDGKEMIRYETFDTFGFVHTCFVKAGFKRKSSIIPGSTNVDEMNVHGCTMVHTYIALTNEENLDKRVKALEKDGPKVPEKYSAVLKKKAEKAVQKIVEAPAQEKAKKVMEFVNEAYKTAKIDARLSNAIEKYTIEDRMAAVKAIRYAEVAPKPMYEEKTLPSTYRNFLSANLYELLECSDVDFKDVKFLDNCEEETIKEGYVDAMKKSAFGSTSMKFRHHYHAPPGQISGNAIAVRVSPAMHGVYGVALNQQKKYLVNVERYIAALDKVRHYEKDGFIIKQRYSTADRALQALPGYKKYPARTAYKVHQITHKLDLHGKNVADLCGGPGSTVQLWIDRGAKKVWTCSKKIGFDTSVAAPVNNYSENFYGTPGQTVLIDNLNTGDGDILMEANLDCIPEGEFDFVMADGARRTHKKHNRIAVVDLPIHVAEVKYALRGLKYGGDFLLKMRILHKMSIDVVAALCYWFADVKVFKPSLVSATSPEFYVFCKGYMYEAGDENLRRNMVSFVTTLHQARERRNKELVRIIEDLELAYKVGFKHPYNHEVKFSFSLPTLPHNQSTRMFCRYEANKVIHFSIGKFANSRKLFAASYATSKTEDEDDTKKGPDHKNKQDPSTKSPSKEGSTGPETRREERNDERRNKNEERDDEEDLKFLATKIAPADAKILHHAPMLMVGTATTCVWPLKEPVEVVTSATVWVVRSSDFETDLETLPEGIRAHAKFNLETPERASFGCITVCKFQGKIHIVCKTDTVWHNALVLISSFLKSVAALNNQGLFVCGLTIQKWMKKETKLDMLKKLDVEIRKNGAHKFYLFSDKDLDPKRELPYKLASDNTAAMDDSGRYTPRTAPLTRVEDAPLEAIQEQIALMRANVADITDCCERFYKFAQHNKFNPMPEETIVAAINMKKNGYLVIDVDNDMLKTGKKATETKGILRGYNHCYDGKQLTKIRDNEGELLVSGHIVVSEETKFVADLEILAGLNSRGTLNPAAWVVVTTTQIMARVGVPGCGKTTAIVKNVKPTDLVAVPGGAQRTEVAERLEERKDKGGMDPRRVRTLDSILINGLDEKVDILFIDEFYMHHAGKVLLLIAEVKPQCVYALGDPKQIQYINRKPMFHDYYAKAENFTVQGDPLNVTFRCPRDIAYAINDMYPFQVYSASNVTRSVQWSQLSNFDHVARGADHLLAHRQSLVAELKKKFGDKVNSTHEYQGNQAEKIACFRKDTAAIELYESQPHALVAFTRHTQQFTYCSTDTKKDAIRRLVEKATAATDVDLDSVVIDKNTLKPYVFPAFNCAPDAFDEAIALRESDVVGGRVRISRSTHALRPNQLNRHEYNDIYSHVITRAGFSGAVGDRVVEETEALTFDSPDPDPILTSAEPDVAALQRMYDDIFPGVSAINYEFDQFLFHNSRYIPPVENCVVQPMKMGIKNPRFERMRPVLRTSAPAERIVTQHDVENAISVRNCSVPQLAATVDDVKMGSLMARTFIDTYVDHEKYELFESFRNNPIEINEDEMSAWLDKKDNARISTMKKDWFYETEDLRNYDGSLKPTPKPDLSTEASTKYAAAQVIAAHPQCLNVIFGPVVRQLVDRIMSVLDNAFAIFVDVSPADFAADLTDKLTAMAEADPELFKKVMTRENDFSKYDKSQCTKAMNAITEVFKYFGLPEWLARLVRLCHRDTRITFRKAGVRVYVDNQMKSGVSWTLLGNTIFGMCCTAMVYDLKRLKVGSGPPVHGIAVFVGDDSIIYHFHDLPKSHAIFFAYMFNLEVKALQFKYPSFCSKFIIRNGDRYVLVPDIPKVLSKLGRRDLVNREHVEDYRVSLVDTLAELRDARIYGDLSDAINERYGKTGDHSYAFSALVAIVHDKDAFQSLFEEPAGPLCMDPTRRSMRVM